MPVGALNDVNMYLVDSFEEVGKFFTWLSERHEQNVIAFDTETTGLNPYGPGDAVRLIQIGDTMSGWSFPPEWHGAALQALRVWRDGLVGHNISFENNWLRQHYPTLFEPSWHRYHDTMIQAHIDDPTRSRALKNLGGTLIDPRAASSQGTLQKEMAENGWTWKTIPIVRNGHGMSYWIYGALDTILTARLHCLPSFTRVREYYRQPYELEMGALQSVANMQFVGTLIDLDYCDRMIATIEDYAWKVRGWAKEAYGVSNLTSGPECIRKFKELGYTFSEHTPKGADSLNKDQLEFFVGAGGAGAPLAQAILDLRRGEKWKGPYFDNFHAMVDINNRVHPTIWTCGTRTARMSITEPALQTLPRKDPIVRDAFIPAPGHVLISIDADQIELRLATHFSRDEGLQAAFATGDDFFSVVASEAYGMPVGKDDPRRGLMKNGIYACLPLDSEILTDRGWLDHSQVQVGDSTVGLNHETGRCEWTPVTRVVHYDDAPLVKLHNQHWSMTSTPHHRWVYCPEKSDQLGWTTTEEFGRYDRILLAAPFDGQGLPITDDEARLLGWSLSDGSFEVKPFTGGPSQGRDGQRRGVYIQVQQSEKKHAGEILTWMHTFEHEHVVKDGYHTWKVRNHVARDLAQRIGFYTEDGERPDPGMFAAQFSADQRAIVLDAIRKADTAGAFVVKTDDWLIEFYRTLVHLDGQPTSTSVRVPDGKGWQRKPIQQVRTRRSLFTGQRFQRTDVGRGPVWCVQTGLGTWTTRQEGRSMLTGNTLYGAGITKIAMTAGVPVDAMEAVMESFHTRFPGIRRLQGEVEAVAKQRTAEEGRPYVITPTGRKMLGDPGSEYALINYQIQSHAAEILKLGIMELELAGLGPYLRLPVHDELVLEVPIEEKDYVLHLLKTTLDRVGENYLVPLTWGPDVMEERWGQKYKKKTT